MIIGIGTDLADIRRHERTLKRFGTRFVNRIFNDLEKQEIARRNYKPSEYAKRFAAKEACSKALGTGLRQGVFWRDMGVKHLKSGKPTMELTGGAKKRLDALTPEGMRPKIDVSLTDEPPLAHAIVIISAVAADSETE